MKTFITINGTTTEVVKDHYKDGYAWFDATSGNFIVEVEKTTSKDMTYDCSEERNIIGSKIRQARKAAGMNPETLGTLTGIGRANIIGYETGRLNATVDMLSRINQVIALDIFK